MGARAESIPALHGKGFAEQFRAHANAPKLGAESFPITNSRVGMPLRQYKEAAGKHGKNYNAERAAGD